MNNRVKGLDGLRVLSAIGVALMHFSIFDYGWMGVQVFYVISGFLITGILLQSKNEDHSRATLLKRFYFRRSLRILPLYIAYLLLFALLAAIFHDYYSLSLLPWLITYVFNIQRALHLVAPFSLADHLWSLSIEEQFYLVWPFLVLFLSRKHFRILAAVVVMLSPLARYLAPLMSKNPIWSVYFITPFQLDGFAVGAFLSTLDREKIRSVRIPFLAVLASVSVIALVANRHIPKWSFGWLMSGGHSTWIWGYSLVNLIACALVMECVIASAVSKMLDIGPLRYLGRISYGFYVWHLIVVTQVRRIHDKYHAGRWSHPRGLLLLFLFLAVTTALASLSYHFLERPFLRYKDRFFHDGNAVAKLTPSA